MRPLSRVKSFIRTTDGDGRPAGGLGPVTGTSRGQDGLSALVIIASTERPGWSPSARPRDSTRAGRRRVVARSVKGNGTTTTSKTS